MMKNFLVLLFVILGTGALSAQKAPTFEWELRFDTRFDNHERNAVSHLGTVSSQTFFSTRLVPVVGIGWGDPGVSAVSGAPGLSGVSEGADPSAPRHRIMAGGSFTLDFATAPSYAVDMEPIVFYNYSSPRYRIYAGKFERRHTIGSYSRAMHGGVSGFYDNVVDGVALQYTPASGKLEAVLDWDGAASKTERESFRVLSAGELNRIPKRSARWVEAGYSLDWYHLASRAGVHDGVADHILAEAWAGAAFERVLPGVFDRLALRVGAMQSFDRDRAGENRWLTPAGATLDFDIRKWRVGIRNRTYIGGVQMPLWSLYGNRMYKGDSFYAGAKFYNFTQIYWSPRIGRGVNLDLQLGLHTDGKGLGFQQVAIVGVSLDRLFFQKK